jgi:hypothetical protein
MHRYIIEHRTREDLLESAQGVGLDLVFWLYSFGCSSTAVATGFSNQTSSRTTLQTAGLVAETSGDCCAAAAEATEPEHQVACSHL